MVREARNDELEQLLELYLHLHETEVPVLTQRIRLVWQEICADPNHHILVWEEEGRLVSSCVCVVIPNLTRGVSPYAFVENVVTHRDYRGKGFATACLNAAKEIAQKAGCYKMMLLTGAKDPATLRFYERAGYNSSDKTAFIQWI